MSLIVLIRRRGATANLLSHLLAAILVATCGCDFGGTKPPDPLAAPPERETVVSSPAATMARIRRQADAGNIDQAERELEDYLLREPGDSQALVLASEIAMSRGRYDQAFKLLDDAARSAPQDAANLRMRAALLFANRGQWKEAIGRLTALVKDHPELDEARTQLVELLNQRGFRFDANEHIRELIRRGGVTKELLGGLMVPARTYTGNPIDVDLSDTHQVNRVGPLNVARDLLSKGDAENASRILGESDPVRERNPCAVALQGQTLLAAQDFAALENWLDQVPSECRRYPSYWIALGGRAMRGRQHDQAVRLLAEAVVREPGELAVNDRMTQALAAGGHVDASERFRQRGIQIDALTRLARSIVANPNPDSAAFDELSRGLHQIGRSLEALAWYEVALQNMGAPPEAMRKVQQAKRLVPEFDVPRQRDQLLCGINLDDFPLDTSFEPIESTMDNVASSTERPEGRQPAFTNIASMVGLEFQYRNAPVPVEREFRIFQQLGAGVACLDFDLDGNTDLYVGQASGEPPHGRGTLPNALLRNQRPQYVDVTERAGCDDRGYSCGVTAGDWNQDGFPDVVVGNIGANALFINQGDGTFQTLEGDAVWNEPKFTAALAMGDIDGDHLPDIVEVNYLDDPRAFDPIEYRSDGKPVDLPGPLTFTPAVDRVFFAQSDGTMSGRTLGDPSQPRPATGLGVLLANIDGVGGNELFIANDHMANHLWERTDNSRVFRNMAAAKGVAYGADGMPLGCMGIAAADFDSNGRLDLHVTNFENQWSNQYMQNSAGFFDDLAVAFSMGTTTYKMLGFGTQAIDYDNNSSVDIVVGNGHVEDYTSKGSSFEMPTQVFSLQGSRFAQLDVAGDKDYWQRGHLSRGLAVCDWNNDGRVDFVVTDLKAPLALLENRTESDYHWLQLQLVGRRCERDAIGTTVTATVGGRTTIGVVQSGDGYMCKNQPLVCFGLGNAAIVDRLEISWPGGDTQTFDGIAADHRYLIVQGDERPFALVPAN